MSEQVGALATEAALLLDAVAAKLGEGRNRTGPDGTPVDACPTCGHRAGESCTACPICRFLAVLRGERPEVSARWVEGALTIVQALRSMIPDPAEGSSSPNPEPPRPPTGPASTTPPAETAPRGLQHIEIR